MRQKYIFKLIVCLTMFTLGVVAQEPKQGSGTIEGLSFYPNPVSSGKIYVTSKLGLDKEVIIYDVLGKKVLQTTMNSKELNVSSLAVGVYIIRFREGDDTATRKLIIR